MASVSSLDKDLRQLRLDKYTPQAAKEVRDWIEEVLVDRLGNGDLLEVLKDGLVLCRFVWLNPVVVKILNIIGSSIKQSRLG
jgi:transgelin